MDEKKMVVGYGYVAELLREHGGAAVARVNAEHPDGLVLEGFRDVGVFGVRPRSLPCLSLSFGRAVLGDKDRAVGSGAYVIRIELHLRALGRDAGRRRGRYMDALRMLFEEHEFDGVWERARVTGWEGNVMEVRVEV